MNNTIVKFGISLICVLLFVSVLAPPAKSQDVEVLKNKTPEQRAKFQTDLMKSKLQLDTNQMIKTQAINLKYAQQMEPALMRNDSKLKKYRAAMSMQKNKDTKLKKVFSAEQYKLYQTFKDELRETMRDQLNKQK